MSVWDDIVGQDRLLDVLRSAVDGAGDALAGRRQDTMTQAWLFTGPPGSGRSNAARAFAAALLCEQKGCGACQACRTVLAGTHGDVIHILSEQLSIGVDTMRDLVRRSALSPVSRRWLVIIVEDADRLTDKAADALLKSIEEPTAHTVWVLCAPTVEDVLPTIRSRCRVLVLRTPPSDAVAAHLVAKDGVPESVATFAARASQGHIGRARALALDDAARNRRREVLRLPTQLVSLGACMTSAANVVDAATEEATPRSTALDAEETADLASAFGGGGGGRGPSGAAYAAAVKELQKNQRQRAKRLVRDSLDRSLLDLASFYRDVLTVQMGGGVELVNEEQRSEIEAVARRTTAEQTARHVGAIFAAREAVEGEVAPILAVEALMISLSGGPSR